MSTSVSETFFWFPLKIHKSPYYRFSCFSLQPVFSTLQFHLPLGFIISSTIYLNASGHGLIVPSIYYPGSTVALSWWRHSNLSCYYWLVWYFQDSALSVDCHYFPPAIHSLHRHPSWFINFYRTSLRRLTQQKRLR